MNLLLLAFSLMLSATAHAQAPEKTKADTNREVVRTYARIYLETKEYARAEEMILEYQKFDALDPNLWLLLGQVQMKDKKLEQACFAYQKAAQLFPKEGENRVYANYAFADCLNQSAKTREAKAVLEQTVALQGGLTTAPEDVLSQLNSGKLRSGVAFPEYQRKKRGQWRVSGAIGSGFDTNVLLVDEDVVSGTAVSDRGSFFVTPALQVGYAGTVFNDAFDSRYIASYTDYLNSAAQGFNSLYQRADFSFGSGPIRWGVFGDLLFLNRNPFQVYNYDLGVSYLNIRKVSATYVFTWEVPIKYQRYPLDGNSGPDDDRTGEDVQIKATARWIKGPTQFFNLQGIVDGQYTKGKNYRQFGLDVPALYLTNLPGFSRLGLINTFTAEAQLQYYLSSSTNRRDLLLKVAVGLVKPIEQTWNVNLDVGYQKNLSSVLSARYNKLITSLQLTHEFL